MLGTVERAGDAIMEKIAADQLPDIGASARPAKAEGLKVPGNIGLTHRLSTIGGPP